jgi:NadR type nicotinamide-nucleotide adenylyltransferase
MESKKEINVRKIVVLGPESTGKSTLCQELAQHYQCLWCPEYAREYLLKNGMNYSFENLLTIAKGQLALEQEYLEKARQRKDPYLFVDTDQYVMKVWCEFVFGKCHQWIIDQIVVSSCDHYFLCNNDLPWVKDELREYPDLESREKLYNIYKDIMINQSVPWTEIHGNAEIRLKVALEALSKLPKP